MCSITSALTCSTIWTTAPARAPLLAEKVREGNLGAKTGQGFFSWQGEDGKRIIESRNKALLRALKNDAADAAAAQA